VYLQRIHGLSDEEFLYAHVNRLLNVPLKTFIKKAGTAPQTLTQQDYIEMSTLLSDSERCHVCLLVMETKKEIELTFLSKAVN
jgi:PA26 p53-induced protein (sestrin)